ncbi:MAG: thiamine pyrophosphate-dependent dehydrogenase E1 component subunit alpha [Planctomycetota bacterium]
MQLWSELVQELSGFCALKQPLFFETLLPIIIRIWQIAPDPIISEMLTNRQNHFLKEIQDFFSKSPRTAFLETIECYPDLSAKEYCQRIQDRFLQDLERFFARQRLRLSLNPDEKRQILFWMKLTRSVDDRGESLYFNGPPYKGTPFGGKGFKSTGQEAIVASVLRLNKEKTQKGNYRGDIVGPMIRDLGVCLAMGMPISWVFNAQLGKNGPPMYGKDIHIGDLSHGVYPPTAPLAMTIQANVGIALAFKLRQEKRVVINFSGDGATSLGEWHSAINFAAVQQLPIVFVIQDNQIALSTWKESQCLADHYADKGPGYGLPNLVLDGNNPEAIFSAITESAEFARSGKGPTLIELKTMRMSGHAFHDTSAYLAGRKQAGKILEKPYVRPEIYERWKARDPISLYSEKLLQDGILTPERLKEMESEIEHQVNSAEKESLETPWPTEESVNLSVFAPEP